MSSITTNPRRIRARQIKSADEPLSADELDKLDAYWRALNYLAVGQIYLLDNPLLREPLSASTSSRGCSATGARRRGLTCCACISIGSSRKMI